MRWSLPREETRLVQTINRVCRGAACHLPRGECTALPEVCPNEGCCPGGAAQCFIFHSGLLFVAIFVRGKISRFSKGLQTLRLLKNT